GHERAGHGSNPRSSPAGHRVLAVRLHDRPDVPGVAGTGRGAVGHRGGSRLSDDDPPDAAAGPNPRGSRLPSCWIGSPGRWRVTSRARLVVFAPAAAAV